MYSTLLNLHSWNRWIVLLLCALVVLAALRKRRNKNWTTGDDRLSALAVGFGDLQMLLGIVLYFTASHFARFAHAPAMVMVDRVERFWAMEHPLGMIAAIVLMHVGRVKLKRAAHPDRPRPALSHFGFALLLMLLSLPWPGLPYGRPFFRL